VQVIPGSSGRPFEHREKLHRSHAGRRKAYPGHRSKDGWVEIRIADTGRGIPEENWTWSLRRFSVQTRGNRPGPAITSHIVEEHGDASSREFHRSGNVLPFAAGLAVHGLSRGGGIPSPKEFEEIIVETNDRKSILLVDDHQPFRDSLAKILSGEVADIRRQRRRRSPEILRRETSI